MQFKKYFGKAILAASVLALVGTAQAATREINLYGASAQYLFWNDAAEDFLGTRGCSNIRQAQDSSGKNGVTLGDACTAYGGDNVVIRYSSKASFDGIRSMKGVDPDNNCPTEGPFYRKMADESTISGGVVGATKCVDVTLGASDVAGETFIQESHGELKGHLGGGQVDRSFNAIDTSGLTPYRPVVVPFGFFANSTVPLTNMPRLAAVMIFSGSVTNWSQFNPSFPDEQIVVCLRHAGSGTHATLDAAVMRGDWPLVTFEDPTGSFGGPIVYFNDGSSDLMKCVDQNAYAVGYADADQSHGAGSSYANVKSLAYMGESASRENIKNGLYDFWSAQWLYEDPTEPNYAVLHPVVVDLMNYASDPANLPSSKSDWWATQNEMQVTKANDFAYPSF